jgi:hypothetical protein
MSAADAPRIVNDRSDGKIVSLFVVDATSIEPSFFLLDHGMMLGLGDGAKPCDVVRETS